MFVDAIFNDLEIYIYIGKGELQVSISYKILFKIFSPSIPSVESFLHACDRHLLTDVK